MQLRIGASAILGFIVVVIIIYALYKFKNLFSNIFSGITQSVSGAVESVTNTVKEFETPKGVGAPQATWSDWWSSKEPRLEPLKREEIITDASNYNPPIVYSRPSSVFQRQPNILGDLAR